MTRFKKREILRRGVQLLGWPPKKEGVTSQVSTSLGCERFGALNSLRIREGFGGLCACHRYSTCQCEHDVCYAGLVCILILYFCVCAHVCQHLRLRSCISTSELDPQSFCFVYFCFVLLSMCACVYPCVFSIVSWRAVRVSVGIRHQIVNLSPRPKPIRPTRHEGTPFGG